MPITIVSKTFSDEFNTGTTTDLVNSNVSDIWTATINIAYSNIIDASIGLNNGDFKWNAYSSDDIARATGGLQVFEPNQALGTFYKQETLELKRGFFVGASFAVTGFSGAIDGTYTIKEIVRGINGSNAKVAIICNESFVAKKTVGSGRFAITEPLTAGSIDYRASGTNTEGDYSPTIEINGLQPSNYSSSTAALDASSATVVTMPFSYSGAYQSGSLTISGVSFTSDVQKFELIHTFRAIPISIYNDSASTTPLPSDFSVDAGDYYNLYNSLGGYASMKGGFSDKVAGGLNVPFTVPYSNAQTNFRTFNNKYIGGVTDYSISSLVIVRTSDSYDTSAKPIVEEKFTVTFNIDSDVTPFSDTNTKVKVGIENLPEIITNLEDYEQQYLSDYAIEVLGAAAGTGNAAGDALSISAYTATFVSTSQISISFDVDFTANAQTQIDLNSEPYFSIYVETQDHTLDYTNSDRTVLSVFSGVGIQKVKIDPIVVNYTKFLTAPYTLVADAKVAADVAGFPVQLLYSNTEFSADWTSRTDLRIDNITQTLVLKNTSTLEEIALDSTIIPVNTFTLISDEYPNANYSVEKSFKIPSTEKRNLIEMNNVSDVSSVRTFNVMFPFFVRWEDYTEIIMASIPPTILDTAEDYDGKNYDLYRIDAIANWTLSFRVNFECTDGEDTFTQDFDYVIPTSTYDAHPEVSARSIKTYNLDGTTLKPTIVASGLQTIDSELNTVLEVVNTVSPQPNVIGDFEYEFYIEGFENGSPTKIQRISSINNLLSGSWFDDTGLNDGLILKTINGAGNPVGTCLIDVSNLVKYDKYRVYSTYYTTTVFLTFTFQTDFNSPTDGTFSPTFTASGGELPTWTLTGGTIYSGVVGINQTSRTSTATLASGELDGTSQNIDVSFSTNNPANIDSLNFNGDEISGIFDISLFTGAYDFDFGGGNLFTSAIIPITTVNLVTFYCNLNTSITAIDFTNFGAFFGGNIQMASCSAMQTVTFPTSSRPISRLTMGGSDITGALVISGLSGLGGQIEFDNNSITSVAFPTSSTTLTILKFSNNSGLATADLSTLSAINGRVDFGTCALTSITFHANTIFGTGVTAMTVNFNDFTYIDFTPITADNSSTNIKIRYNNINATNMQQIIDDFDTKAWTGVVLEAGNQSPALTAGEKTTIQASAAYLSLIVKTYTITL